MVEPGVRFCQWHLVKGNAFEHGRIGATDTLGVGKTLG